MGIGIFMTMGRIKHNIHQFILTDGYWKRILFTIKIDCEVWDVVSVKCNSYNDMSIVTR